MTKTIAFLVLLLISPGAYAATKHDVGGSGGWNTGVNYGSWAGSQTFAVGDSLVFTYDFSHAVDEVNEADYNSCNTANAISSDSNSPTTISLTGPGKRYFICPRSNHCSQGMKLAVTVTGSSTPSGPTPPSGGPSPPGSTPSPPSETPPSTSVPPPAPGAAASTLGVGKGLMAGLSVVLAAMLGLMD